MSEKIPAYMTDSAKWEIPESVKMKEFRCKNITLCRKKNKKTGKLMQPRLLFKYLETKKRENDLMIEIMCPRCKTINIFR